MRFIVAILAVLTCCALDAQAQAAVGVLQAKCYQSGGGPNQLTPPLIVNFQIPLVQAGGFIANTEWPIRRLGFENVTVGIVLLPTASQGVFEVLNAGANVRSGSGPGISFGTGSVRPGSQLISNGQTIATYLQRPALTQGARDTIVCEFVPHID